MPSSPSSPHGGSPRGIRLHNPGNIRHGPQHWEGQATVQPDPDFVAFDQPVHGLRAMMKIFQAYARRGVNTPAAIIATWAPPNENDTSAYIAAVAGALGVTADTVLDLRRSAPLIALARVVVHQEQGTAPAGQPPHWYPDALYADAAHLALTVTGAA